MVSPINYLLNGADPMASMQQGMAFGQQQRMGEQDMLAQAQGMELQMAQEGRAQTQFGQQNTLFDQGQQDRVAQQQAAEAAKAQAMQMQSDMAGLAEKVGAGAATSTDFAQLSLTYPDMADELSKVWEGQTVERKAADVSSIYSAAAAIKSGRPDIAISMLEERAEAADASGDKMEADVSRAMAETIKASPESGLTALGMLLHSVDEKASADLFGVGESNADRYRTVDENLIDLDAPGGPKPVDLGIPPKGPEWRNATAEEAAAQGAAFGQINTVTGEFEANNPPSGMQLTTNPDGTVSLTQGPAGAGRPPTEGALAASAYLSRMEKAELTFEVLAEAGTNAIDLTDTVVTGTRAEPYKLSVPEQRLVQAQRDWVRAKLRKESGAVIGPEEMAEEIRTYFPQPGEGKDVIEQKRKSRKAAEEQMRIMGWGAGSGSPENPGLSATFDDAFSKYGATP